MSFLKETSIKKTWPIGPKTWYTGDSVFVKALQAMYADKKYFRIYDNGSLMDNADWDFNLENGFKIGSVEDLTDGVKILSPQDGHTYSGQYDEPISPFQPILALYRADKKMVRKGMPNNFIRGEGPSGPLVTISVSGDEKNDLDYAASYDDGNGGFTKPIYYVNRMCVTQFPRGQALPNNWRIELYKQGRHWSGVRRSGKGSYLTTMNTNLSPRVVYTTNEINTMFMTEKKKTGVWYVRMRNTDTNEVSLFSFEKICCRKFFYSNAGYTAGKGSFHKITLR